MEAVGRLFQPLPYILLMLSSISGPILMGWMDTVKTDERSSSYAEKPVTLLSVWFPQLQMPLNALVNLGYVIVGLTWLHRTYVMDKWNVLNKTDVFCANTFAWMSIVYTPIQLARILTMSPRWVVADQWVTLPITSWVVTWGLRLRFGWRWYRAVAITALSIGSYLLTLHTEKGFEIALAVHIVLAVLSTWPCTRHHPTHDVIVAFCLALFCCSGFVCLKLLDHDLPKLHWIFTVISGHFLSKIADFMQIYYISEFFSVITQEVYIHKRKSS